MTPLSGFLVAGPETGVGKTTVTVALLAALRRRGLRVQAFKVGPDYIDPGFLTRAAGRLARNLDSWLLPPGTVRWLFQRHAATADVAVVEGMMGLFDGYSGLDDRGSSAHVARLLRIPVLVVLDAARAVRSVAAVARGCQVFDRRIEIAGWILDRVAGETHLRWVRDAIEQATGRPVLGHLFEDARLRLPERHLGLVQAQEGEGLAHVLSRLVWEAERRFDLNRILRATRRTASQRGAPPPLEVLDEIAAPSGRDGRGGLRRSPGSVPWGTSMRPEPGGTDKAGDEAPWSPRPARRAPRRARPLIAWAADAAFTFHYADNIELLEALGAEIVPWSPLRDRRLPAGAGALVLGGGYPELHSRALAANTAMVDAVRSFVRGGGAVYAECGGFMYLARGIAVGARRTPMVGVIPAWAQLSERARVAYVEVRTARDTLLAPRGTVLRGHEFHASHLEHSLPAATAAYRVLRPARRLEGYARAGVLASYVHLNFLSQPILAARLIAAASVRGG